MATHNRPWFFPRPFRLLEAVKNTLQTMREDVKSARQNDPAARNDLEVILAYPGVHAIWMHRVAHKLWQGNRKTLARVLSHFARFLTGIEIHPGAKIGRGVFIDHGMGVVIGETATVGDNCLLYQGVVLGGTSLEKKKRHPDLEEGVVVGAGAIVLGPIRIGKGTRIGAGSVVIKDVPPYSTVVGVPGKIVAQNGKSVRSPLDHANLPDPLVQALRDIETRLSALEAKVDGSVTKQPRTVSHSAKNTESRASEQNS